VAGVPLRLSRSRAHITSHEAASCAIIARYGVCRSVACPQYNSRDWPSVFSLEKRHVRRLAQPALVAHWPVRTPLRLPEIVGHLGRNPARWPAAPQSRRPLGHRAVIRMTPPQERNPSRHGLSMMRPVCGAEPLSDLLARSLISAIQVPSSIARLASESAQRGCFSGQPDGLVAAAVVMALATMPGIEGGLPPRCADTRPAGRRRHRE